MTALKIQREFLDWRQPALAAAVELLRGRFQRGSELDLSGVIVVVPGGRAGRRLLEIFVAVAEERQLLLTPPTVVTPDAFPELLYQPKLPFADVLTQQLAWSEALRSSPPDVLAAFLPVAPQRDDTPRWLAIGQTLRRLHLELAADGLDCAKVLKSAADVEGFTEDSRWRALCQLQEWYLKTLDGLKLWDIQTARLVAIENREITTNREIVLLGTVDLNRAQRQMLDQIADRVTSLIVAPRELADRFDEYGCLVPAQWTEAELPLADAQIERVDGPAEQAEAVTRWLASLGGKYGADQIAIGLPDEKLVPQIERQLAQCGLASRWAIGKPLTETGPFRLLKVAADFATRGRYRELAALVRHPDVFEWLSAQIPLPSGEGGESATADSPGEGRRPPAKLKTLTPALSQREREQAMSDSLTALDHYASERFPARLDPERLAKEPEASAILTTFTAIQQLLQPLVADSRPLSQWSDPLRSILEAVYGARPLERHHPVDRYLLKALELLAAAFDGLANVPPPLQPAVDARQACRIVLAQVSGEGLPPPADPGAIELLGWLDLPLDDAPATLVTTFNEGFVPEARTADALLPNRLREALGLLHNDRRLARDAYALALLCASRQALRLLVAHRDGQGNPLTPSRLLFLTGGDRVVERALAFFGPLPEQAPRRNLLLPPEGPPPKARLDRPRPQRLTKPLTELSVTKFRDYISCPYRFYLRHVLGLEAITDEADEMDGGAFGDLAHHVLEQFGRADEAKAVRVELAPKAIADYLDHKLDQIAAARFGPRSARPAIVVQIEQLRLRLRAFAAWQAGRNRDGWRIVFSEDSESKRLLKADWEVDGKKFTLRGRIDRIDYNERLGKLSVLDYKTADRGNHPERTHRRRDEWIDLQLPLYRHLVREANLAATVSRDATLELGYIVLPLDVSCVGLLLAGWDEGVLQSADDKAYEIIRAIRAETFWPPTEPPPDFFDDVAVICQDRRMGAGFVTRGEDAA
jgi:ATP-dependent helicase/nuclease subunit B